ncbi:hypothetical protein HanXRQr2_Chr04g0160031 [Helianthus annuus]|uniref:Uncharacterized protein n=1 Tax=Helianthus annuus TaxID=4232 RepID=A0A9K3NRW9_HELAN|nr:hypothetical protein HanXRQr2_Chr04g0160031 [Helianthus annuus]KAJ0930838.1 hypothetical protein HanPSC8_Chr04g0154131 [Helianthus annuus]
MMIILAYAHIGMDKAIVTLKDARLVNYVMFLNVREVCYNLDVYFKPFLHFLAKF